jgi:putative colanic acid biosynthesis acetyltransferase WcaF
MNINFIQTKKNIFFLFYLQLWRLFNNFFFLNFIIGGSIYRIFILRVFGAKIGANCVIKPNVVIYNPLKIKLGNNVWIGEYTNLYSLDYIIIEDNVVVSQYAFLCTGSHDIKNNFKTTTGPILIKKNTWICAKSIILKNVVISENKIIEAGSLIKKNI